MSVSPEIPANTIRCPKCGQTNPQNNFKCTACGFALHVSQPISTSGGDGTLGGLIPYKNGMALAAYYCGVFGLIPCLGLPVALAAIVLGILGLNFAKKHPEAKGKAHAWTGIILGTLVVLGTALIILSLMVARYRHQR